ncbi:hypothetical protein KCU59_g58, partial [Aureobasidium melanogenum]
MMPRDLLSFIGSSSCMQTAHMPRIPFRGVLSSCEILAMKSVLLSLAASAAFLLSSSSAVRCFTLSSRRSPCEISQLILDAGFTFLDLARNVELAPSLFFFAFFPRFLMPCVPATHVREEALFTGDYCIRVLIIASIAVVIVEHVVRVPTVITLRISHRQYRSTRSLSESPDWSACEVGKRPSEEDHAA